MSPVIVRDLYFIDTSRHANNEHLPPYARPNSPGTASHDTSEMSPVYLVHHAQAARSRQPVLLLLAGAFVQTVRWLNTVPPRTATFERGL